MIVLNNHSDDYEAIARDDRFGVALQAPNGSDDGSLSVYIVRHDKSASYFNLEAAAASGPRGDAVIAQSFVPKKKKKENNASIQYLTLHLHAPRNLQCATYCFTRFRFLFQSLQCE